MSTERIGDMDPKSKLSINRDASGDIIVTVFQSDEEGSEMATVEFCTIGPGGGQSPRTFEALLKLKEAMEEDNKKGRAATPPTLAEESFKSIHYYRSGSEIESEPE